MLLYNACSAQIMRGNFIRGEDYYKSNIRDEEDGPVPWSVVAPAPNGSVMAWHSRSNYASLPPPVAVVASIFSTLIRGPIGRRHRIYYNLQRIFRWGALLLLPLPHRASPNDTRRYITEQETVWGKKRSGEEREGAGEYGKEEMAMAVK